MSKLAANGGNAVNELSLPDLYAELASTGLVTRLLELARDEDLGLNGDPGDLTCAVMLEEAQELEARIMSRAELVTSGLATLPEALKLFAPNVTISGVVPDGTKVPKGTPLATFKGPSSEMLRLERPVLNLVGRLSGIATRTAIFHEAMVAAAGADCRAKLLDTRKTTPGLRVLEKYAVRCGGGFCHRLGLHDAVLIKDNHLAGLTPEQVAARVGEAAQRAAGMRAKGVAIKFFEVEVDTLEQLDALLTLPAGAIDFVLLDNMPPDVLAQAVAKRDASGLPILLEASGGVSLESIGAIAKSGVDRVSVGGLTHQAVSIDIGLDAV
mmetsp:Transcript_59585/g.140979  ORF Transcript_59585/g.140979 Transcript_59585/m.140979 type:complete len:325 (+) Transcript_59585:48-1022(+)